MTAFESINKLMRYFVVFFLFLLDISSYKSVYAVGYTYYRIAAAAAVAAPASCFYFSISSSSAVVAVDLTKDRGYITINMLHTTMLEREPAIRLECNIFSQHTSTTHNKQHTLS